MDRWTNKGAGHFQVWMTRNSEWAVLAVALIENILQTPICFSFFKQSNSMRCFSCWTTCNTRFRRLKVATLKVVEVGDGWRGGGGVGHHNFWSFVLDDYDLKRSVDLRCLFDHRCYIHPFRWSCSRINSQCSSLGDLGLRGWWRRIDAQTTVTVDHEWVRRSFDAIWWRHPSLSGKSPIELVKLRKKSSIRGGVWES